MDLCEIFMTFGDCNCNKDWRKSRRHPETTAVKQDFFAAAIKELDKSRIVIKRCHLDVQTESETYFISNHDWHRRGAQRGDSVIFQASGQDVPLHHLRYGRVFQVLRQNAHNLWKQVLVEPLKEGAFTIDAPETKFRDDAITIENCKEHQSGCKKIGAHITAVALEYPSKWPRPPSYKSWRFLDSKHKAWSLDQGKIVLAVSIYTHTGNGKVDGPVFTPIRIKTNYSFGDKNRLLETFASQWSHFMGENALQMMLQQPTRLLQYINNYGEEWKMPAFLDKIMVAFTSTVTKYAHERKNVSFITKPSIAATEFGSEKSVCVFEDLLTNATQSLSRGDSTGDMALLKFAAAGKVNQMSRRRDLNHFPRKYLTDVEMSEAFREDSVVKCTSPLRDFHHFVNQQILISCMTGAGGDIYSKDDLLGILTVRFETPVLRKPLVDGITDGFIHLGYHEGLQKAPKSICQLSYQDFTDAVSEEGNILLKNVECKSEDFCNREMVRLNSAKFEEFTKAFERHEACLSPEKRRKIFTDMAAIFTDMAANKTEEIPLYQTVEKDTRFCPRKGMELQIQVSETDAVNNIALVIRLLRGGINCHVCFTHRNHPVEAYMSDRSDIRRLINLDIIEALKLKGKLNLTKLCDVTITWNGNYGSGGSFRHEETAKIGDLLCIRKEITRNNKLYVWSCHAIVSAYKDTTLSFATCTLSQEDSLDSRPGSEGFCGEIMSLPFVQDLDGKSQ